MIEIRNVSKRYGNHYAVKDVSFTAAPGEVLGFLGRNGAGKSTTMNMITGYIPMTEGTITVDGWDVQADPFECRQRIGYLPEIPPLYMDMTVEEYLRFCCDLRRVRSGMRDKHIRDLLGMTGLTQMRSRLIRNLSKGYRQRTGIAQALAGNPEVIILDEPTVGLDPTQMIEIRELIRSLKEEHTVILSSHILTEIEEVCTRVVIINAGRVVLEDSMDHLRKQDARRLRIRLSAEPETALQVLRESPEVLRTEADPEGTFTIDLNPGEENMERLFWYLSGKKCPILMLTPEQETLESCFLRITREELSAQNHEDGRKEDTP